MGDEESQLQPADEKCKRHDDVAGMAEGFAHCLDDRLVHTRMGFDL